MSEGTLYFDNAATTLIAPSVRHILKELHETPLGNPSGVHALSLRAAELIAEARTFFAHHFSVDEKHVIFTSGGTESNNLAISGVLSNSRRKKILTTPIEHSSVQRVLDAWQKKGYTVSYIKVDAEGQVDLDDLQSKLDDSIALVCVMAVNNEIGSIQPIQKISESIQKRDPNIHFHVDGVQAFGKTSLPFYMDTLSISSHKIHGPKGVGALICKDIQKLTPLLYGGHQEAGLRSGTENTEGIYGFYKAACEILQKQIANHDPILHLNRVFREGLSKLYCDVRLNSPQNASPYILNVSFQNFPAEVMLRMLEEKKIYVSAGSSCNMKSSKPSPVLKAIGLSDQMAKSALRFSFSSENTLKEVQTCLNILQEITHRLHQVVSK